jgi:hypothetical protein
MTPEPPTGAPGHGEHPALMQRYDTANLDLDQISDDPEAMRQAVTGALILADQLLRALGRDPASPAPFDELIDEVRALVAAREHDKAEMIQVQAEVREVVAELGLPADASWMQMRKQAREARLAAPVRQAVKTEVDKVATALGMPSSAGGVGSSWSQMQHRAAELYDLAATAWIALGFEGRPAIGELRTRLAEVLIKPEPLQFVGTPTDDALTAFQERLRLAVERTSAITVPDPPAAFSGAARPVYEVVRHAEDGLFFLYERGRCVTPPLSAEALIAYLLPRAADEAARGWLTSSLRAVLDGSEHFSLISITGKPEWLRAWHRGMGAHTRQVVTRVEFHRPDEWSPGKDEFKSYLVEAMKDKGFREAFNRDEPGRKSSWEEAERQEIFSSEGGSETKISREDSSKEQPSRSELSTSESRRSESTSGYLPLGNQSSDLRELSRGIPFTFFVLDANGQGLRNWQPTDSAVISPVPAQEIFRTQLNGEDVYVIRNLTPLAIGLLHFPTLREVEAHLGEIRRSTPYAVAVQEDLARELLDLSRERRQS